MLNSSTRDDRSQIYENDYSSQSSVDSATNESDIALHEKEPLTSETADDYDEETIEGIKT